MAKKKTNYDKRIEEIRLKRNRTIAHRSFGLSAIIELLTYETFRLKVQMVVICIVTFLKFFFMNTDCSGNVRLCTFVRHGYCHALSLKIWSVNEMQILRSPILCRLLYFLYCMFECGAIADNFLWSILNSELQREKLKKININSNTFIPIPLFEKCSAIVFFFVENNFAVK